MKFFKYKEITHATLEISKIYLNQTPAITFFFFSHYTHKTCSL